MCAYFVPTRFVWRFGGQQVHLCGSFTRWVETMPMAPVDSSPDTFAVVVHLPPGYHQYKFIVDGDWRHDESQPYMPDPLGNVNNWLFVRRPDGQQPQGPQPSPSAQQVHSQAHQQQPPATAHPQHQPPLPHGGHPHQPGPPSHAGSAVAPLLTQASEAMASSSSGPAPAGSGGLGEASDADTPMAESPSAEQQPGAPIVVQADDPEYTRRKVRDFLATHTAYELIPESGKVVLLDSALPIRQAFHALHEQGIASAPLWDSETATVPGMVSASDFIQVLQSLRTSVSSSGNPLSEAEMDRHTLKGLREGAAADGRAPKPLVFVRPGDPLSVLVQRLFAEQCSLAPVVSGDPLGGGEVCTLLAVATLGGVLACLLRHFRASLASLPLLGQPLGRLPLGTWSADSPFLQQQQQLERSASHEPPLANGEGQDAAGERRNKRKVRRLATVTESTPLTTALGLLLQAGVSALPVLDDHGALVDIYARADITALAAANAYSRLQWEDVTVGQALRLGAGRTSGGDGGSRPDGSGAVAGAKPRFHTTTVRDPLRAIVERLAQPGVRRLVVIDPDTHHVEGIVSLSDVAAYLLL